MTDKEQMVFASDIAKAPTALQIANKDIAKKDKEQFLALSATKNIEQILGITPFQNIKQILEVPALAEVTALIDGFSKQHEQYNRLMQAVINPLNVNITPAQRTPIVIDHEADQSQSKTTRHHPAVVRQLPPIRKANKTGKTKKDLKCELKSLKDENNELKNRLINMADKLLGVSGQSMTAIEYYPQSSNILLQNKDNEITNLKTQLEQKEQEIHELQAKIDQLQTTATPANDDLDLIENQDKRTVNNLVRVLLAINEMAKAKQGEYIDFQAKQVKQPLETINKHLDFLGYGEIKDTAYNTIRTLIRERQQKGL